MTPTNPSAKFKIAICGGGVGGISLAVALSEYVDVEVAIYESVSTLEEIGAGVTIWGRAWRVLSLMGLDKSLRKLAGVPEDGSEDQRFGFDYRLSDEPGKGRSLYELELPYSSHQYHRAHFLDILLGKIPKTALHLGKRLVSYSEIAPTGTLEIKFMDGTSAICDALIGCDGIRSTVRKVMFQTLADRGQPDMAKYIDPVWTGEVVYRTLIPADLVPLEDGRKHRVLTRSTVFCGHNKHMAAYPIALGKWVNFGGFVTKPEAWGTPWNKPWASECDQQEFIDHFANWESGIVDVLKCVQKPLRWAVFQVRPLPLYAHGSVALVGDAAHAMSPHQGSGVGQAIEDAYVLAGVLGHPSVTRSNLSEALKSYEHVRLPFVNNVAKQSAESGALSEFRGPTGDDLSQFAPALRSLWSWVGDEGPDVQIQRAIKFLVRSQTEAPPRPFL